MPKKKVLESGVLEIIKQRQRHKAFKKSQRIKQGKEGTGTGKTRVPDLHQELQAQSLNPEVEAPKEDQQAKYEGVPDEESSGEEDPYEYLA